MENETTPFAFSSIRHTIFNHIGLDSIFSVARRFLVSRFNSMPAEDIDDALQEALCKLLEQQGLRAEINDKTVYSWLLTVAQRELMQMLRYEERFVSPIKPLSVIHDGSNPALGTLGRYVEMGDRLADTLTLHTLLASLPTGQAEAVRMHYEGYPATEIATLLGCTKAAAYKRIQRGCAELRRLWREDVERIYILLR